MDVSANVRKLNEIKSETRSRYIRNMTVYLVPVVLLIIGAFLILAVSNVKEGGIYFLPGAMGFVLLLVGPLIMTQKHNQEIKNQLIEEIVKVFNQEQVQQLRFEAKPKEAKDFNVEMGLFTRIASLQTDYKIEFVTKTGLPIKLLNCRLVTSNGKSQQVHFWGFYFIAKYKSDDFFQIRSRGKPRLKDVKFKQLMRYTEKIFLPETDVKEYVEERYVNLFHEIRKYFPIKALYLASNREELHLAVTPRTKFSSPKTLTSESFIRFYRNYTALIELIMTQFDYLSEY